MFTKPLTQTVIDNIIVHMDMTALNTAQKVQLLHSHADAMVEVAEQMEIFNVVATVAANQPAKNASKAEQMRFTIAVELNQLNKTLSGHNLTQLLTINQNYFPPHDATAEQMESIHADFTQVILEMNRQQVEHVHIETNVDHSAELQTLNALQHFWVHASALETLLISMGPVYHNYYQRIVSNSAGDINLPLEYLPQPDEAGEFMFTQQHLDELMLAYDIQASNNVVPTFAGVSASSLSGMFH